MTKAEIREAIKTADRAADYLHKTYGEDVEMQPWRTNDHPISMAHWMLTQGRISAHEALQKPILTPKQRQARSERMKTHHYLRQNPPGRAVSYTQIDDLASVGPAGHPTEI